MVSKKINKIYILGRVPQTDKISGPAYVFLSLYKELKQFHFKTSIIDIEFKERKNICCFLKFLIKVLFTKKNVINIHSYGYLLPLFFSFLSLIDRKNTYVLTLHGISSNEDRVISQNVLFQENILIKLFPIIICVSNLEKEIIQKKYNRHKSIYVIHNGIEKPDYSSENLINFSSSRKIRLIMAGGFSKIKSTQLVIDFVHAYNSNNKSKVELEIYGPIRDKTIYKYYKENEQLLKNMGISYNGMIPTCELMDKYKEFDFAICLSTYETFNLTALQAMRMATPVLVSKQCGVHELIEDGINGFVFDIRSKNLSMEIENVLQNMSISDYIMISKKAYITATQFTWSHQANKYYTLFKGF